MTTTCDSLTIDGVWIAGLCIILEETLVAGARWYRIS